MKLKNFFQFLKFKTLRNRKYKLCESYLYALQNAVFKKRFDNFFSPIFFNKSSIRSLNNFVDLKYLNEEMNSGRLRFIFYSI